MVTDAQVEAAALDELHLHWSRLSRECYGDRLPPATFKLVADLLPDREGRTCVGECQQQPDGRFRIALARCIMFGNSFLPPHSRKWGRVRYLKDVVSHESIHCFLLATDPDGGSGRRHFVLFYARALDLADRLGLPRPASVDALAGWPMSHFPESRYL